MNHSRLFKHTLSQIAAVLLALAILLAACQPSTVKIETQTAAPTVPPVETNTATALPEPSPSPTPELAPPTIALPSAPPSRVISPENAARVTVLRRLGKGFITGTPVYAPGGSLLAVPSSTGIDLYAAQSLELVRHLDTGGWVDLISFSPDGKLLAAYSPGNSLFLWNVEEGASERELVFESEDPYPYILDLAFSPNGQWVAAAYGPENLVAVWRVADGALLQTLKGSRFVFSPDAKMLAASLWTMEGDANRYTVFLYNTEDGALLNQWEGQRAVFSATGLLAVENKGTVRMFDIDKDLARPPLEGSQAAFSPDGQTVALYTGKKVILYDIAKGAPLAALEGTYGIVDILRFSPDGQTLAGKVSLQDPACCQGGTDTLVLWRVADGSLIQTVTPPAFDSWSNDEIWADYVSWFDFAPDGQSLVVAASGSARLLRVEDGSVTARLSGYTNMVAGLAFSPDGQSLASASGSPVYHLRMWNVASGEEIRRYKNLSNFGDTIDEDVAFTPDGKIVAMGNTFWRVADGSRLDDLEHAMMEAYSFAFDTLAFAPDGKTLAAGYFDGKLHLWDLEKRKLLRELGSFNSSVNSLAYSPDGRLLAAAFAGSDKKVQVWRMPEGQPAFALENFPFLQVAFAPDSKSLATIASEDETAQGGFVQLWGASDGRLLHRFETDGATRAAFSSDGQVLAVGLSDGSLRLWRVSDYTLLATLKGHRGSITGLAFSPNGELLASCSNDGTVVLWGLE